MKFSTILITVCCLVLSVACNNNKQNESSETKSSETIRNINELKARAEQGVADAQYNLGVCYYNGEGVTKDYAEAVRWWRKAAEQGHADAKRRLNEMGIVW